MEVDLSFAIQRLDGIIEALNSRIENQERESLHDRRVRLIEKGMEIYGIYFLARHKDTDNYTIQIHILEDVAKIWADAVIAATREENE